MSITAEDLRNEQANTKPGMAPLCWDPFSGKEGIYCLKLEGHSGTHWCPESTWTWKDD